MCYGGAIGEPDLCRPIVCLMSAAFVLKNAADLSCFLRTPKKGGTASDPLGFRPFVLPQGPGKGAFCLSERVLRSVDL